MRDSDRLLESIESPRFAAVVNLASDLNTFMRILRSRDEVRRLSHQLSQEPEDRMIVFRRLLHLLGKLPEPSYEHPFDAALAAYLFALSEQNDFQTRYAAGMLKQCDGCWWARKLAEQILKNKADPSTTTLTLFHRFSNGSPTARFIAVSNTVTVTIPPTTIEDAMAHA